MAVLFQEHFDQSGKPCEQLKPMIRRKKVRAYIARRSGLDNPDLHRVSSQTLHGIDSGYVHAMSPHIMDTYLGDPPRFHIAGMQGTPREAEARWHMDNYFYRGLSAFAFASMAFAEPELYHAVNSEMRRLEVVLASTEPR